MSMNETNEYLFLRSNYLKLKEFCSVNILVSIVGCSTLHLDFILGSRLYNPLSIVYIFHGESIQNCDGSRYRSIKYGARVRFTVVYIYLAQDNLSVARAYLLCISCFSPEFKFRQLSSPYQVLEVQNLSRTVKILSAEPAVRVLSYQSSESFYHANKIVLSCSYLYRRRRSTQPPKIGCSPLHLLTENIAAKMNYSVIYVPSRISTRVAFGSDWESLAHYSVFTVLGLFDWSISDYATDNLMKQVLRGHEVGLYL